MNTKLFYQEMGSIVENKTKHILSLGISHIKVYKQIKPYTKLNKKQGTCLWVLKV